MVALSSYRSPRPNATLRFPRMPEVYRISQTCCYPVPVAVLLLSVGQAGVGGCVAHYSNVWLESVRSGHRDQVGVVELVEDFGRVQLR